MGRRRNSRASSRRPTRGSRAASAIGAMKLWNDPKRSPIKRQLAMLPAQAILQYPYGQNGYIFPRDDHVVIGRTIESGVCDDTADKSVCVALVDHIKSLFGLGPIM